jgi:hypothetical protein
MDLAHVECMLAKFRSHGVSCVALHKGLLSKRFMCLKSCESDGGVPQRDFALKPIIQAFDYAFLIVFPAARMGTI